MIGKLLSIIGAGLSAALLLLKSCVPTYMIHIVQTIKATGIFVSTDNQQNKPPSIAMQA